MKRLTVREFGLVLLEIFVIFLLLSQGGKSVYRMMDDSDTGKTDSIQSITPPVDEPYFEDEYIINTQEYESRTEKEYIPSPFWLSQMKISIKQFRENITVNSTGFYKVVVYAKVFLLFVIVGWVIYNILVHNIKKSSFEYYLMITVKLGLILFFLISGFIYVIGNIDPDEFFNYGQILDIPRFSQYFSIYYIPLMLAIILTMIDIMIFNFKGEKPKPVSHAPKQEIHH